METFNECSAIFIFIRNNIYSKFIGKLRIKSASKCIELLTKFAIRIDRISNVGQVLTFGDILRMLEIESILIFSKFMALFCLVRDYLQFLYIHFICFIHSFQSVFKLNFWILSNFKKNQLNILLIGQVPTAPC